MPKADRPHTTPRAHAPVSAVTPLPAFPSLLDLGRHRQATSDAADRIDRLPVPPVQRADKDTYQSLFYDREDAIGDLMLTLPAQTIGDAAAQLCAAFRVLCELDDFELPRAARDAAIKKLRRAIISAVPAVARAAGIGLAQIGGSAIEEYHGREFPDLDAIVAAVGENAR